MTIVKVDKTRQEAAGRKPKLDTEQINTLVTKYNEGATQKELAHEFGISVSTVRKYLILRRDEA